MFMLTSACSLRLATQQTKLGSADDARKHIFVQDSSITRSSPNVQKHSPSATFHADNPLHPLLPTTVSSSVLMPDTFIAKKVLLQFSLLFSTLARKNPVAVDSYSPPWYYSSMYL